MGEIADMMLEGVMCCQCGQYLDIDESYGELGFPVICDECYACLSKKEKEEYKDRLESIFIKTRK